MGEDITKSIIESIKDIPPIIKYPALLMLIDNLYNQLPNAKKEYDDANRVIMENLLDFIERMRADDYI